MKDLIRETVEKIKERKIAPEPRWKYLARKYGAWVVFGGVVFLGAISFSTAFDLLRQLDWDLYRFTHQSALVYSLTLLPYFWLILIGMFLVLAFFDLRKTETGYKYGWLKISLSSIGGIIVMGFVFSLFGFGGKFNAILANDIPYYGQHMTMTKEKQWMQPDHGFLSGTIVVILGDGLEMIDLSGQKWKVFLDEKTLIKPAAKIVQGEMIKIIGSRIGEKNFQASEIRPWMGQGGNGGVGPVRGGGGLMRVR